MSKQAAARLMTGIAAGLVVLGTGATTVSAYPPGDTTPTTVLTGGQSEERRDPVDPLAATGFDTGTVVWVAVASVAGGAGLLVTARRRRATAPA